MPEGETSAHLISPQSSNGDNVMTEEATTQNRMQRATRLEFPTIDISAVDVSPLRDHGQSTRSVDDVKPCLTQTREVCGLVLLLPFG